LLKGHTDWIFAVAFSPDGTEAASFSRDRTLRLWNLAGGIEIDAITVDGAPTDLVMRGDRILVGNSDSTVTIYRWSR
jgi:WD40 repeat protein